MRNFRPALGPGVPLREWENLEWMGEEYDPRMDTVRKEAAQISSVVRRILDASKAHLIGSPLLSTTKPLDAIGADNIEQLRRMRLEAVPLTAQNNRLHAHLEVAGVYAQQLAAAVNKATGARLPEHALQASGELNDIGKLTGIFRYHFTDVLGDTLLDDMGIRPDIQALFMPTEFHVGPVSVECAARMKSEERDDWVRQYCEEIYDSLTLEQKIFIYADICGKPKGNAFDDIQTFEDMREVHLRSRASGTAYQQYIGNKEPVWPSEIYAIKHIEGFADGWMWIYEQIKAEFEHMGVSTNVVRETVRDVWRSTNGPKRHEAV